jgi:hypothetical protein
MRRLYLQTQLERVSYRLASCTNQHLNFELPAAPPIHVLCKIYMTVYRWLLLHSLLCGMRFETENTIILSSSCIEISCVHFPETVDTLILCTSRKKSCEYIQLWSDFETYKMQHRCYKMSSYTTSAIWEMKEMSNRSVRQEWSTLFFSGILYSSAEQVGKCWCL